MNAWRRLDQHLKPGRAVALAVVLAVMAGSLAVAVFARGRVRLVAAGTFAAAFILGGLAANWLLEPREDARVYPVAYEGLYPPLPQRSRARVQVLPEGLAIRCLQPGYPYEIIRHSRLRSARMRPVEGAEGRAAVHLEIDDPVSGWVYTASLLFATIREAEDFMYELARHRHASADALWAPWRTVNLHVEVTDYDLQHGFRRVVPFTRTIACPRCGGIEGADPRCPNCGGRGTRTERDVVEVVAPPGTRPDRRFVFEHMGNEDPSGRRGAVVVRLARQAGMDLDELVN